MFQVKYSHSHTIFQENALKSTNMLYCNLITIKLGVNAIKSYRNVEF